MSEIEQRARELVAHVQSVYDDGGYAAGDGEPFPLDEMQWLLDEVEALRAVVRKTVSVAPPSKLPQYLGQIAPASLFGEPLTIPEGDAIHRALGNQEEYDRG